MIYLQKFCGNADDSRINRPWSVDGWTMATDGKILIRVPLVDGVEENPKAPDVFHGSVGLAFDKEPEAWVDCPNISEPQPVLCPVCGGDGSNMLCPECDGAGVVYFDTQFNDYGCFECLSCRGSGKVSKAKWSGMVGISMDDAACSCERCHGKGTVFDDKSVDVSGVLFGDRYLALIGELPEAEIGVFGPEEAAKFRFSGGDGLLMPRRNG